MTRQTQFLLVEDSIDDALLMRMAFGAEGARCLRTVYDGRQAIDYLIGEGIYADRQLYPLPHVILLALKMPRLDGFDFLDWLRNQAPPALRQLPAVVMSCSIEPEDVRRARSLGVTDYVQKPSEWPDFKLRV